MPIKWTNLPATQLIQFFDPNNPQTAFYIPQINPQTQVTTPGNVRQYTQTVNGTAVIIGSREYPPSEIKLTWSQLDISDLKGIAFFTNLSPVVFVDNNNNGFLGVLTITQAGQVAGLSSNVWSAEMSFLVIGPYDGTNAPLPQLSVPVLTATEGANGSGFIPNSTGLWFWLTVQTKWGESLVGNSYHFVTSHNNSSWALQWLEPTSSYHLVSRLYWATANTSSSATFLTEVQKGFANGSGFDTFSQFAPYVQYSAINPPNYGTAYTGYFAGGQWIPDTTNQITFSPAGPYHKAHGGGTLTFTLSEEFYSSTFTCDTDNHTVATISGTSPNFTVTTGSAGTCTITATDTLGNTSTVLMTST